MPIDPEKIREFAEKYPHMLDLLPITLEICEEGSIELAITLAVEMNDTRFTEELYAFATGSRGSDAVRYGALVAALDLGYTPPKDVWMTIEGQRRLVEAAQYRLSYHNPQPKRAQEAEELYADARDLLIEGEFEEAEDAFRKALEIVPGDRFIEFDMTRSLLATGRKEEAIAIINKLYNKYPAFVMPRVEIALLRLKEGRLDEAKQVLRPEHFPEPLHPEDFANLCYAQVVVNRARRDEDAFIAWSAVLKYWEPDHPVFDLLTPPRRRRWR